MVIPENPKTAQLLQLLAVSGIENQSKTRLKSCSMYSGCNWRCRKAEVAALPLSTVTLQTSAMCATSGSADLPPALHAIGGILSRGVRNRGLTAVQEVIRVDQFVAPSIGVIHRPLMSAVFSPGSLGSFDCYSVVFSRMTATWRSKIVRHTVEFALPVLDYHVILILWVCPITCTSR